ncbi:relaxase/mobilization nuclease domain-containing protein [Streptomyces sp. B-S-A8]|uniref:Relaxase/mobilization nuclease domain-containing protein n=1 Tax=Streptomyces solicavernae TaxID=3043614 RepID=A0ABT6S0J8_9ACTN|nr:relaxase/mobilization nuclease domain-containing protein [Streptomyces sp. B-S-A8]MDI3390207.1 relaxase/mobilization nuclease domain-containing protein [Streptomyces sp. B-S-A8]
MIANIVKPGNDTYGVVKYLFGKGRANEHTDQHIVASWDDFILDPGPYTSPGHNQRLGQLIKALDLRVEQAGDKAPSGHVWHCSVRAAPEDRILTDAEWATIARRMVHATGIAPKDDPDGCRWVAVRHADGHIHIVATKVRGDLRPARNWNDYHRAMTELANIEKDFGLTEVPRSPEAADGTAAAKRPTRAEQEKAKRLGHDKTARERLRHTVRAALSHAQDLDEFFNLLADAGLQVETRTLPSGDLGGYKVALPDDGTPIWYSGSSLATDLSLPQIQKRLAAAETPATPATAPAAGHRRPSPWHQATAAAERIPHHLDHADDPTSQAHLTVFGEVLYALPAYAPVHLKAELHRAALAFEHAAHTRARADHQHARALRGALKAMRYQPADGTGLAMLLDAAILVVLAAQRRSALRHHDRQVAAARQTLTHLQAAYDQIAPTSLAQLGRHRPSDGAVHRYARTLVEVLPSHAEQILGENAWPALTATLAAAEASGHEPAAVLQQAARQRSLDDAKSASEVLVWRIQRLGERHAPSSRARAAQTRSPHAKPTPQTATGTPAAHVPTTSLRTGRSR